VLFSDLRKIMGNKAILVGFKSGGFVPIAHPPGSAPDSQSFNKIKAKKPTFVDFCRFAGHFFKLPVMFRFLASLSIYQYSENISQIPYLLAWLKVFNNYQPSFATSRFDISIQQRALKPQTSVCI